MIDPERLKPLVDEKLKECLASIPHLLSTSQGWSIHADVYEALAQDLTVLVQKVFKRAALFGDYRVTSNAPKRLKKQVIHLRESDISLAWQSLEQDLME